MTDPLAEFLLARIAEDEAAAQAVPSLGYVADMGVVRFGPTRRHFARWDPARVLAECKAKRRIVEEHPPYSQRCQTCGGTDYPVAWPCPTLRFLALPYADHDQYREEWKP